VRKYAENEHVSNAVKPQVFMGGFPKQAFLVRKTAAPGHERRQSWGAKQPRLRCETAWIEDQECLFCFAVPIPSPDKKAETAYSFSWNLPIIAF